MNNDKVCPQCGRTYGNDDRFCTVDGASLVSSGTGSLIGTVVADRFLVHEKLGEGGMGEVYLAEHVRIKRKVALKLMRPWMIGDPVALGRFHREAENASQISHPNVAQVYDFGETADKLVYLAMEFVDGESLSKVLERERYLHMARTAEIVRQIGEALNAAHTMGILHRDLKPDNVMVGRTRYGTDMVKLVDFGIARAMNRTTQQFTSTGLIIGTPDYMSPEQLSGDALDERSDLYALALIAYRALTGTAAYPEGASGEALIARMTAPPRRLAGARPEILWPQSLQTAFDRALAADPVERFADPMEFVAELDAAVSQMPLGDEEQAYLVALSQRMPTPARGGVALDTPGGARTLTPSTPTPSAADLPAAVRTQPRTAIPSVPARPDASTPAESELATVDAEGMEDSAPASPNDEPLATAPVGAAPRRTVPRRPLIIGGVAGAALIAILASVWSQNSAATNGPVVADSLASATTDSLLLGVVPDTAALIPAAAGTLADSVLAPAVTRATVPLSSRSGSGVAVLIDPSGLALTAASLIPSDSVVHLYVGADRMVRATVVTVDRRTGLATLLVPMRHCPRCTPLRPAFAPPAVGDSVVMMAPRGRGLASAVRGAVSSVNAEALGTTLTLTRGSRSAPVVAARTADLVALSVGTALSTTTMLQEAVVRAKAVPGRVASDSLIPTWPEPSVHPSRLTAPEVAKTEEKIASYQLPGDEITVLVMTPQVMKFRSREATSTSNPMAIESRESKDQIASWRPWTDYVGERRAVVILDAAGHSASFPFTSGSNRRVDIRAIRLYRGDTLIAPIETGRYPSTDDTRGSVPWSGVAVYSPLEFRPRGNYRIDVDDARQRTARIELKVGTLERIRADFGGVLW